MPCFNHKEVSQGSQDENHRKIKNFPKPFLADLNSTKKLLNLVPIVSPIIVLTDLHSETAEFTTERVT